MQEALGYTGPWAHADDASRPQHAFDNICRRKHIPYMSWVVEIAYEFDPEFDNLHEEVQTEILDRLANEGGS